VSSSVLPIAPPFATLPLLPPIHPAGPVAYAWSANHVTPIVSTYSGPPELNLITYPPTTGVLVGVPVAVGEDVGVLVEVGVVVGVSVMVAVCVGVPVAVCVGVCEGVAVGVCEGVCEGVCVGVCVGVGVVVGVAVCVGVCVGVAVGIGCSPTTPIADTIGHCAPDANVNVTLNCPSVTVALNTWSSSAFMYPTCPYMSRFVNTVDPSIDTLNTRSPVTHPATISPNFSVTSYSPFGTSNWYENGFPYLTVWYSVSSSVLPITPPFVTLPLLPPIHPAGPVAYAWSANHVTPIVSTYSGPPELNLIAYPFGTGVLVGVPVCVAVGV
jgi:hypothetical protein